MKVPLKNLEGRTLQDANVASWHLSEVDLKSALARNTGRSWRSGDRQRRARFGLSGVWPDAGMTRNTVGAASHGVPLSWLSFQAQEGWVELGDPLQAWPILDDHGVTVPSDQFLLPKFLDNPVHVNR